MTEEITNADGSRNWEANILFDNVKRLEQENAELKEKNTALEETLQTIEQLKDEDSLRIAQLVTENERLKEDVNYACISCANLIAKDDEIGKYHQTLQEIKAIAEQLLEKGLEPQSVEHQLRLKGKRELASIILYLITKVEEE